MHRLRNSSDKNRLDVWMAPSFASKWLMPRLHSFTALHPEIDLRITASDDLVDHDSSGMHNQAKHFHQHGMDVAIRFGDGHYPACRVDHLMPASVVPLCSPQLMNDANRPLSKPQDLKLHTLLHDDTPYEGRPEWADWLRKAGVRNSYPEKGLHFNHVSLALEAACDGQGVVLSLEQIAQNDIERGRLVVPFDLRIEMHCAYYIISLTEAAEDAGVSAFRQWLLEECTRNYQDRRLSESTSPINGIAWE
jgi:LysR family glycine cleavage system transcriptional activator